MRKTQSLFKLRLRISNETQRRGALALCIFVFAFFAACSMPNLEQPECTEARDAVKEFYSYHFGNEMKFTPENLRQREKFLTPELLKLLQKFVTESDPFTLTTNDPPRAFRVSGCQVIEPNKTDVRVLIFWRDDTRTEQREIHAETVKQNGNWLVNDIYNEQIDLKNNLNH